jgi:magnesium-transporting ATPase (P-type)
MRTTNLLEKGILSRDDSIFHHSAEDLDKIITEHEAASQIINEHRTLHFFLLILYTIVVFGINAHFLLVVADFKAEAPLCLAFSPSSYTFLLGFSVLSILASITAIRRSTRKLMNNLFFARQRFYFAGMLLCSTLMLASVIFGSRLCRKQRTPSRWSIAWALITGMQALLLRSYTGWVDHELASLEHLADSSKKKKTEGAMGARANIELSFEAPTVGTLTRENSQERGVESGNLSLNSITTV